jgi:hypothetical protein
MGRFVEGTNRGQSTLFPECLEDWIGENNPVRVIDVFVGLAVLFGIVPINDDRLGGVRGFSVTSSCTRRVRDL